MEQAPTLRAEELDFAKLFPELPQYSPPHASDDPASQKRRDDSHAPPSRLVHVTRLLDSRPVLVSTLDPANYHEHGLWVNASEWAERLPSVPEGLGPGAVPPHFGIQAPGSLLFARRSGKVSREHTMLALHAGGPPAPPARPESRIEQLSWSADDDAFVQALAKQYRDHWALVADVFNSARLVLPTEKRTAWDCYERCKWLADEQRAQRPPPKDTKKQHRQNLLDTMRKWAKRRELSLIHI